MKSRIPELTSGHLDRSFCFEFLFCVQKSDQNFNFEASRGRIRICLFAIVRKMKLRIPKRTSKKKERSRCPEVRVGMCEILVLAAAAVARMFLNALTIRCQGSIVDG